MAPKYSGAALLVFFLAAPETCKLDRAWVRYLMLSDKCACVVGTLLRAKACISLQETHACSDLSYRNVMWNASSVQKTPHLILIVEEE